MSSLVSASEVLPFALLRPEYAPPRDPSSLRHHGIVWDPAYLPEILSTVTGPLVIDLETNGTQFWDLTTGVVGIGLAWDEGCVYCPVATWPAVEYQRLLTFLSGYKPGLVAHNVMFDGAYLWRDMAFRHPTWYLCTYAAYRHLATEGFFGQTWSLKAAQKDVLLWSETNEVELDQWLVRNGHTNKAGDKPDKSKMHLAPVEILGHYCMLDAESTYLLLHRHLLPLMDVFPEVLRYEQEEVLPLIRLLTLQTYRGMQVDVPSLQTYQTYLTGHIAALKVEIMSRPDILPHAETYFQIQLERLRASEPTRYKIKRERPEPKMYTKAGAVNKGWIKWDIYQKTPPEERLDWKKWERRIAGARDNPEMQLDINKTSALIWLLFSPDALGFDVQAWTDPDNQTQPSTAAEDLLRYGDVGRAIIQYREAIKELGYVDAYLTHTGEDGILHAGWKTPGALTGRLAGKEPNIQQCPKSEGILRSFISRPGYVWVDYDLASIEDVVLAEFSMDRSMLEIYGPDAKPNDGYLFIGSRIAGLREGILASGYDPSNPTKEGMAQAKKEAKKERAIAKAFKLASNYGAGPGRLHAQLSSEGVDITIGEVQEMHRSYWEDVFPGVRSYMRELEREWRRNGGWLMSGTGRPIGVAERKRKDIMNSVIQSTAHDILLKLIRIVSDKLDTALGEGRWYPLIIDWHDQLIIEVPEGDAELAEREVIDSFRVLNEQLQGHIKIKGTGGIRRNLAECKLD